MNNEKILYCWSVGNLSVYRRYKSNDITYLTNILTTLYGPNGHGKWGYAPTTENEDEFVVVNKFTCDTDTDFHNLFNKVEHLTFQEFVLL